MAKLLATFDALPLSVSLIRDLQSDHAGEAGAVRIYDGILAVSKDPEVRRFAAAHRAAEYRHLAFFEDWLPGCAKSRLLPLWRGAGWLLGAGAALFGRRSVFRTIAAVETFVDAHYAHQIEAMRDEPRLAPLVTRLQTFRADEVHHRDDAAHRLGDGSIQAAGPWAAFVAAVSALGVAIARRV